MTNDQIIELAKQTGLSDGEIHDLWEELKRFAELVRNEVLNEVGCALIDNQFVGCHKAVEILRELKS